MPLFAFPPFEKSNDFLYTISMPRKRDERDGKTAIRSFNTMRGAARMTGAITTEGASMIEEVLLASKNAKKSEEIHALLHDVVARITPLPKDAPDVIEDGTTFYENALKKADEAFVRYGKPVIADDSGLEIAALHGAPGIYSARFAGENATQEDLIAKALHELRETPKSARGANFRSVIVFRITKDIHFTFEGKVYGAIITEPRGEKGFGYDPIFVPTGETRTFAEMEKDEKNYMSHRGIAFTKVRNLIAHMRVCGG